MHNYGVPIYQCLPQFTTQAQPYSAAWPIEDHKMKTNSSTIPFQSTQMPHAVSHALVNDFMNAIKEGNMAIIEEFISFFRDNI